MIKNIHHLKKFFIVAAALVLASYSSFSQSGPAGIGSSSDNVLWLRSDQGTSTTVDGAAVSQWQDISGNTNHANQPNPAKRPTYVASSINGLPALRFTGTNVNFVVDDNDNLDNTSGVTIFVVGQPNSVDANPRGMVSKRVGAGSQVAYSLFSYTGSNLYFDAPSRMNGTTSVTNSPQVFAAVFNGNDPSFRSRVFQNGSQTGQANAGANTSIGSMASDLFIGILNDNYGDAFRGDMSEVIIYRTALNRAERSIVEVYLANRYNIALTTYSFGSTTYNQQLIGVGNVGGDRSILTQDVGSGLLLAESNGSLDTDGEFVFAGHNGTAHGVDNSNLPDITPITLTERWQRVFYVERQLGGVINAGNTDIRLGFNYSGTGVPTDPSKVYYLLYRAGTSGDFSVVPGGTGVLNNDVVWFNISNANFSSGYYTIAQSSEEVRAWYSFNDGNWNDFNTWSLNPDSPLNPADEIPGIMDKVVIQASKTVTVTDNNISAGVLEVNAGILDFGTATGQSFSSITGQSAGTIRLAGDNFPSGDASGFANAATGGTVEYYGMGYSLTLPRTFRNVKVNLANASQRIFLLTDYTLNGNLTIERGELQLGDGASTAARNLTVFENVEVQANGKILTGTGNARHQFNLYGDFTNQGEVQFTNRVAVSYATEANNGMVDVNFRSATRNQNLMLEGPSRFYRIAIEKGTTSTYELYMEASNAAFFSLFGYAAQGHPDQAQLTANNNAFGLAYGTVRVGPNITIDRLNQGGNYNVSEHAVLWVDGGSVTKPSGTGEAVVVYGKIKVSNGTFTSNAPSGITSRLNGVFESTGGTTVISQFRTSVFGTQHIGGYIQTGGNVTIIGTAASTDYYSFNLSYEGNVFSLTGGTLTINGTNSKGAIFINSDPVNVNVSANANMNLIATNATPFRITSKAPLPTVTLSRSGAGTREFVLVGGLVGTNPSNQAELPALPLVTRGSLNISDNITFDPRGEDVTIGRSYTIGSGASYNAYSNTTTFSGTTTGYIIFINAGATTKYFHNLNINNPGFTGTLSTSDITIGNNLTILAGTFGTGDRTVTVRGDIFNSGTITSTTGRVLITQRGRVHTINLTNGGSYTSVPTVNFAGGGGAGVSAVAVFNGTPSAGNPLPIARVVITNTGSGYTTAPTVSFTGGGGATATAIVGTTHELGGNGNGVFGNLEVNELHPGTLATEVTFLSAKQTVTGTMTLANGIIDLKTHNLDVGTLHNNTVAFYSTSRMFRTEGNHGDGGLTRVINVDGTYLFPIGTRSADNSTFRYGWANPTFSNVTSPGKVQINGVPRKLATLSDEGNPNDRRYLRYYWRIRHSEFSTLPNVHNRFLGYSGDLFSAQGAANWNQFVTGKVIDNMRYPTAAQADNFWGTVDNYDANSRLLNYSTVYTLEAGEFTSGRKMMFSGTIQVFYSRLSTSDWYALGSNWNNGNNWSFEPHNGSVPDNRAAAGDYPRIGDIAIIGYGGHNTNGGYHSMNILATETVECADIIFVPNPSGGYQPRLVLRVTAPAAAANLSAGIIKGSGTFMMRVRPGLFPTVSADFSDFVNEPTAVFNYYLEVAGNYNIPTNITTSYPNLRFEGTLGARPTIQENFLVKGNLTIDGNTEYVTNSGAEGDFTVLGDLRLGGYLGGTLSFNTLGERTVEVGGLRFAGNDHIASLRQVQVLNSSPNSLNHRLIVNGNIFRDAGTNIAFDLFSDNANGNNVILELVGETNQEFNNLGITPELYRVLVNKGTSQTPTFTVNSNFTLNGPTNGTSPEKALQLQNGRLILNNAGININLSTGGGDFFIPPSAGLVVQAGQVNVSGANTGILLDGLLRVESGATINMDGGAGVNNYIEYSSSGNATIQVTGGLLTVGSQIRRGTTNPSGALSYTQTGGNVVVGKNAAPVSNRGTFEILNTGSRFIYTGGTLTVVRPQTAATEATVLLEPAVGSVGNTTLQIGNDDTPAASVITIKSSIELGNLTVTGVNGPTARLRDRSLSLKRDLTIATGSTFDGTGLFNLTVKRHIINNGTANLNVDTLFLRGLTSAPSAAMQNITGNIRVKHLVVEPETSVTLQAASGVEVDGDLFINSGQFIDGGNTIAIKGNVTNLASHVSTNPNAGGLLFNGSVVQRIFGSGQFGRLEVDNPTRVQLEGSMTLNNHLTLTNGIFHLQHHGLTMGQNANVLGGPFNANKMIAVYGGGFTPQGLRKNLPVLAGVAPTDPYNPADPAYTWTFTYPVGSDDGTNRRYLPVDLYMANNSGGGSVRVVPVNDLHITFSDPDQNLHVLNQYWEVTSSGIAQFTALQRHHYTQDAVFGAEDQYIGARLFEGNWSKFFESTEPPIVVVDEANNWINIIHENVNLTSGDYTAGEPDWIPDQVPIFFSKQDGDWTDPNTWERNDGGTVPANGPVGQRVHIRTAHTVTVTTNFRRAYQTTINGRLELGTTINHILGYVQGTGTLSVHSNSVPTGNYTAFFGCGGGTMEYGGPGTYILSDRYAHYNNLTITGSGIKRTPIISNLTICGKLLITTGATFNQRREAYYLGDIELEAGGNYLCDNYNTFFDGASPQTIEGDFNGANRFRRINIRNDEGFDILNDISISDRFVINRGRIRNQGSTLSYTSTTGITFEDGRFANTYIEGKYRRLLAPSVSATYLFPVGKPGKKKVTSIIQPSTTGNQYWSTEYFEGNLGAGFYDPANFDSPLEMISGSEYWIINGPNAGQATIRVTLTGTSDVAAALGEANKNSLRIVRWNPGTSKWEIVGGGSTVSGPFNSGTITTTGAVTFNGTDQFFTLASVQVITLPTAQFTTPNQSTCAGTPVTLTVALTGTQPWAIEYSDGFGTFTETGITTSPYSFEVTPATTRTYSLTNVTDAGGGGDGIIYGNNVQVTVYPNPAIFNVTSGGDICGGTTTTIHLDGSQLGFTYQLFRNAAYFGAELAGTGGALTFTGVDQQGTYTVRAFNSSFTGCDAWMAGNGIVNLGSSATAEIVQLLTTTPACEQEEVRFRIAFTGTPPFTFSVADGQGNTWNDIVVVEAQLDGTGPWTYNFTVPDNPVWSAGIPMVFTYTITSMNDSGGCGAGTVVGAGVSVDIYKIPETGPQFHIPNTFGE